MNKIELDPKKEEFYGMVQAYIKNALINLKHDTRKLTKALVPVRQAKAIIVDDCVKRNKNKEPGYQSLPASMKMRLTELIGGKRSFTFNTCRRSFWISCAKKESEQ